MPGETIAGDELGVALMERGPMALFGAVVGVGLGPALWLGAQLGTHHTPAGRPPVVIHDQLPAAVTDQGGYGAGEVSGTDDPADRWSLPPSIRPARHRASPAAVVTSASASASPSVAVSSASPSASASAPPASASASASASPSAGSGAVSGSPSPDTVEAAE
ncbi:MULTISPECIES: hypothetical protein [unclassified Actinoplanes]|uniref:hypothetical protein n=1 Tax=unclassified Actinoplanes TaxID=2626549 RepID=UPI0002EBE238|nr:MULTISPECIES: hypothetical protein [unclassified Actinoplanes]